MYDLESSEKPQNHAVFTKNAFPDFHNICVANSSGIVVACYPDLSKKGRSAIELSFLSRSYYKDLKILLSPVIFTGLQNKNSVSCPIITLNIPIVLNGQFYGHVAGTLNLDSLERLLKPALKEDGLLVTVTGANNNVIISTRDDVGCMDSFNFIEENMMHLEGSFYYKRMSEDKDVPVMTKWENSFYIIKRTLGEEVSWKVVIEQSTTGFQKTLHKYSIRSFPIIFTLTIVAFFFGGLVSRLLTNPLSELAEVTTRLPDKLSQNRQNNMA